MESIKDKMIQEFLDKPIAVDDIVVVRGLGIQNKKNWGNSAQVVEIYDNESIDVVNNHGRKIMVHKDDYKKYTKNIGIDPIVKKPWNSKLRMVSFDLDSILSSIGFSRRKGLFIMEDVYDQEIPELNWNPFINDEHGNEVHYQRDFVWSLEDKQALIESIYNNIDIGKIVIRKRSYAWVDDRLKQNKEGNFKDIVDGKQRLNAITDFMMNKFPDRNGYYWRDFSYVAQGKIGNFNAVSYGEIGEDGTDEDVKKIFLGINYTGVQMSQDHIDFVKSIQL